MSSVMPPLEDDVFGTPAPEADDQQVAKLRLPQYSMESESSVLGGLLLDNSAWDRVGDLLTERDFYRHEHQLIYAAIGKLINESKPADVITVFEHLQGMGKAEEVGGFSTSTSWPSMCPVPRTSAAMRRSCARRVSCASCSR